MTEEEKLDAGLYYDFWDAGVNGRKLSAIQFCRELRNMQDADASEQEQAALIEESFGSVGQDVCLCPGFMCDSGKNIHVGDQFLANYNVTILDIMPVHIGDYVMIGPNTLITTVNHPITPMGRRQHLGIGKPVTIGKDNQTHRKRCRINCYSIRIKPDIMHPPAAPAAITCGRRFSLIPPMA